MTLSGSALGLSLRDHSWALPRRPRPDLPPVSTFSRPAHPTDSIGESLRLTVRISAAMRGTVPGPWRPYKSGRVAARRGEARRGLTTAGDDAGRDRYRSARARRGVQSTAPAHRGLLRRPRRGEPVRRRSKVRSRAFAILPKTSPLQDSRSHRSRSREASPHDERRDFPAAPGYVIWKTLTSPPRPGLWAPHAPSAVFLGRDSDP
jgi:hypothetical protein